MFRYRKSLRLTYMQQGYIYFKCQLYKELPAADQETILTLCFYCGGDSWKALYDYMCTDTTRTKVCMQHHISEATLDRMVNKFYGRYPLPKKRRR